MKKFIAVVLMIAMLAMNLTGCSFFTKKDTSTIKVGDLVEVEREGEWWNAEVQEITQEEFLVAFKGLAGETEWVDAERIRNKEIPGSLDEDGAAFLTGDVVQVEWDAEWWTAEILHVATDCFYYVTYDDFDGEWDEWVHGYKIKNHAKLDEITEGSIVEVFWDDEWWTASVTEVSTDRFYYVMYYGENVLSEQWVREEQIRAEDDGGDYNDEPGEEPDEPWQDPDQDPDAGAITPEEGFEFPAGYDSVMRSGAQTEAEGLLYYTQHRDGTFCYYFGNSEDDITHVVAEENGEFAGAVIFNENLYPVHWLFEDVTMAAMWTEDEPFSPETALIKMVFGEDQLDLTLDIRMDELVDDLLQKLPSIYGEDFQEAVDDLAGQLGSLGWEGLTVAEAADQAGTPHQLTMASMLTLASVASRIIEHIHSEDSAGIVGDVASADASRGHKSETQTLSLWGDLGDAAVKALLPQAGGLLWSIGRNLRNLADGKYDGEDIEGPTVGMLLCRGASTVPNYCNHFYLYNTNENLGRCVAICVVTLGCFTEICMPIVLSVEEANGFRTVR